ncbi:MAG: GNAT family N-acetyltransferase [Solobacterium sp.]|nr:GNAT family N-acetyltransferase [Solobacterium sp.]
MENGRKLVLLSKAQIREIYQTLIPADFPPAEIKAWRTLSDGFDEGYYEGYGYYKNDVLQAYAFLVRIEFRDECAYILDYFAVIDEFRGKGTGSGLISALKKLKEGMPLFCEADDPEYAETEEERSVRDRRVSFYKRNGFADTGVHSRVFGCDFVNLEMTDGNVHDPETVSLIMGMMYRFYLDEQMYRKQIIFKTGN